MDEQDDDLTVLPPDRRTFADMLLDLRVGRDLTHATLVGTPELLLDTAERAVVRLYWYIKQGMVQDNLRRWWQRQHKGYDWIDLDNADEAVARRVAAMLTEIADVAYSWPGEEQCGLTFEEWQADLRLIAARLRRYALARKYDWGSGSYERDFVPTLTRDELAWITEEAQAAWARYAEVFQGATS